MDIDCDRAHRTYPRYLNKTMTDVTGFFDQPLLPIEPDLLTVPKLDNWIELRVTNKVVISGVISRHPKYPTGMRILTSAIEGYASSAEGQVFAQTQNSKYELGERLEAYGQEHLLVEATTDGGSEARASAHTLTADAK
jgi:hypothetical protein